jgi:hypothetical protein
MQTSAFQGGIAMEMTVLAIGMLTLIVLVGILVKFYDLKSKREEEAVAAQSRISDALLMDSTLAGLPLTPTAHLPLWKGSPLILEIKGAVPSPELREAAVGVAKREIARSRPDYLIEDRISVDRGALSHAG